MCTQGQNNRNLGRKRSSPNAGCCVGRQQTWILDLKKQTDYCAYGAVNCNKEAF